MWLPWGTCEYVSAVWVNSLDPGRCGYNVICVIFKHNLAMDILSISCEIAIRWMLQDLTEGRTSLVQFMAWCPQALSRYLNQCLSSPMTPHGVTRVQLVNGRVVMLDIFMIFFSFISVSFIWWHFPLPNGFPEAEVQCITKEDITEARSHCRISPPSRGMEFSASDKSLMWPACGQNHWSMDYCKQDITPLLMQVWF